MPDRGLVCERCGMEPAKIRRAVDGDLRNVCVTCDVALVQAQAPDVIDQLPPQQQRTPRRAIERAVRHLPDPVEHWNRVLDTRGLPEISYRMAAQALERLGRRREPGQDDQERTPPAQTA